MMGLRLAFCWAVGDRGRLAGRSAVGTMGASVRREADAPMVAASGSPRRPVPRTGGGWVCDPTPVFVGLGERRVPCPFAVDLGLRGDGRLRNRWTGWKMGGVEERGEGEGDEAYIIEGQWQGLQQRNDGKACSRETRDKRGKLLGIEVGCLGRVRAANGIARRDGRRLQALVRRTLCPA